MDKTGKDIIGGDLGAASAFIGAIHGSLIQGDMIELRCINKSGVYRRYFPDVEAAAKAAIKAGGHTDVYFGIATRDGKGGKKQNILHIPCVWADLDAKGDEPPAQRLSRSPLAPSIVVNSGKGLHCYWLLSEAVNNDSIACIETINKAIARVIGGDSTHDATRVLRIPGTFNHKYNAPLPVELMECGEKRYSIEQLSFAFSVKSIKAQEKLPAREDTGASGGSYLPCRAILWGGVDTGKRNNAAYQLAIDLKKQGLTRNLALDALTKWNRLNKPPLDAFELDNTVTSVYSTTYAGLGCDKHPMSDFCQPNCPVKGKNSTASAVLSPTEAEEQTSLQLPVWTWSALLKREITPPEFIVNGLIPRRGVTLLTGEGGIGKSFIVIELAYAVASGGKFLHHFDCVEGPVLMVDLENDEASIARRIQKITAGRREDGDTQEDIPVYVVKKGDIASQLHIDEEKGRQSLCNTVESYCPSLLVVDPLVAIHSKDENDNIAMRAVVMHLQEIARKYNLAVILLHHPRKRSVINDAGQMIRGASDLRNAVDSHLFLRKVSKEQLIMEHDKSRHAPPLPKFTIHMADNEAETATYIRFTGGTTESLEKEAAARECLLSILQEVNESHRKDLLFKAGESGIAKSTAERALSNLVAEKKIIKQDRGIYKVASTEPELGL